MSNPANLIGGIGTHIENKRTSLPLRLENRFSE